MHCFSFPDSKVTRKTRGFTLVEVLLSVTIAAMLMTGVLAFVSSSLGSQNAIQKKLSSHTANNSFEEDLSQTLGDVTKIYTSGSTLGGWYLTGFIAATDSVASPLAFVGLVTETWYCDSFSGSASETGTVLKLAIKHFAVPSEQNLWAYTVSLTGSSVYSGTTRIIGTGYPGATLGAVGLETELNSPTSVASSGGYLYVSDTMNDRILAYKTSDNSISTLLSQSDGISRPTSLAFSGNTLLIASTGNGKILAYEDGSSTGDNLSLRFKVGQTFVSDRIQFSFPGTSVVLPSKTNFSFTNIATDPSDSVSAASGSGSYTLSGGVRNFASNGTIYGIRATGLTGMPGSAGSHLVRLDFYSGASLVYSDTFSYFTRWDGYLTTITGNTLSTIIGWLEYPNTIIAPTTWNNSINWGTILSGNPPSDQLISKLPVQDFIYSQSGNILTIKYNEYANYDCLSGKHQTREKVMKVSLE